MTEETGTTVPTTGGLASSIWDFADRVFGYYQQYEAEQTRQDLLNAGYYQDQETGRIEYIRNPYAFSPFSETVTGTVTNPNNLVLLALALGLGVVLIKRL